MSAPPRAFNDEPQDWHDLALSGFDAPQISHFMPHCRGYSDSTLPTKAREDLRYPIYRVPSPVRDDQISILGGGEPCWLGKSLENRSGVGPGLPKRTTVTTQCDEPSLQDGDGDGSGHAREAAACSALDDPYRVPALVGDRHTTQKRHGIVDSTELRRE